LDRINGLKLIKIVACTAHQSEYSTTQNLQKTTMLSEPSNVGSSAAQGTGEARVDNNNSNRGRRFNQRWYSRNRSTIRGGNRQFEGREPSLRNHVFDWTGERNPDQYIKTTKEIINYVGRTYTKYTAEFTQAVKDLELNDPTPPDDPSPADVLALERWRVKIKEHSIKEQEFKNFRAGLYNLHQGARALEYRLHTTVFPIFNVRLNF
jgi:hypothetical protein